MNIIGLWKNKLIRPLVGQRKTFYQDILNSIVV